MGARQPQLFSDVGRMATFFPWCIIALNIGAAIINLVRGDVNRTAYWLAAAALNIAITIPQMRFPWSP